MTPTNLVRAIAVALAAAATTACGPATDTGTPAAATTPATTPATAAPAATSAIVGTDAPFASNAIYFVVTDRFVNGDESNDHRDQGGAHPTFDIAIEGPDGKTDNIGYLGGDFQGIVDHADYIRGMGFTAVWVTPIVDNPDEAFTGGDPVTWGSSLTDRGKTGYHGYWATNFYKLDEHWGGENLDFAGFTSAMKGHGLGVVLDIVCNHGSPAFSMPKAQPGFGQLFDRDGRLVADQQNLPPDQLDPEHNPLHRFYNKKTDLAQLSDLNENEAAVLDYLVGAHEMWLDQGAAAFRIDTMALMPPAFWQKFAERIRAKHPGFFMFGEAFDYDATKIAQYTQPASGSMSVLDFPMKDAMSKVFGRERADFAVLEAPLHLTDGLYRNPYELVTFYDNHDMARLDATDEGFIDAHHWLFTARGIPAVYYGSEMGFERGAAEHAGNRNYFGVDNIARAREHPIRAALARVAAARAASPALQRGVQVNLELKGDRAAFYRVYQQGDAHQVALVLLNKGDAPAAFKVDRMLQAGAWQNALGGDAVTVADGGALDAQVPAHGVAIYTLDAPITRADLREALAAR